MSIRVLNVKENKMVVITNVKKVSNCISYFRIVLNDGTFKDYSYKTYDHFPA